MTFEPELNEGDDVLLGWLKRAALRSLSRATVETQLFALAEAGADPVTAHRAVELVRRLRQQARGIGPCKTLMMLPDNSENET